MSLIDQLREADRNSTKHHKGRGLRLFLEHKNEIKDALNAGYSIKTIWEHVYANGKISIKYSCFAAYVCQYITSLDLPQKPEKPKPISEEEERKIRREKLLRDLKK